MFFLYFYIFLVNASATEGKTELFLLCVIHCISALSDLIQRQPVVKDQLLSTSYLVLLTYFSAITITELFLRQTAQKAGRS